MPRTRSGDHTRPTAIVRRCAVVDEEQEIYKALKHIVADDVAPEDVVFGGGPKDKSVLTKYVDHMACKLWDSLDCGELKLVAHGRKLRDLPPLPHKEIMQLVQVLGLLSLTKCSYETIDKGLLFAFTERWHRETNTFHLPIGEMTITLNDVSSLLHIPIVGGFYSYPHTSKDVAIA
ncbi:Protein MAIN-LIKE 2 [Glycine max]|uniref:protein MAIN-LIKE 2-like n=1 Tax=Glycine max TaxID=3847 RepID=UPI0003DE73E4|nr:protein MAIN-LIKE 2-like [Glycine max]XP_028199338.1 protein MAIN-LIKE 2-like [Glycine soja]KAH1212589.1 Protein MAIN-LIKE 2 [Glycine max]|eukprot:XP_006596653.1 protein MAIN-LIKE 2-like [Glycine max]